jgi:hypothetical protein
MMDVGMAETAGVQLMGSRSPDLSADSKSTACDRWPREEWPREELSDSVVKGSHGMPFEGLHETAWPVSCAPAT